MGRAERRAAQRKHRPPRRVQRDRKLRADLLSAELIATFPAAAEDTKADIEQAMQATHDFLIRELGDRRRSKVTWMVYEGDGRGEAIEQWRYDTPEFQGLRDWIDRHPDSVLVVAMAAAEPLEEGGELGGAILARPEEAAEVFVNGEPVADDDPFMAELLEHMSRPIEVLPEGWPCECGCHRRPSTTGHFIHLKPCCEKAGQWPA